MATEKIAISLPSQMVKRMEKERKRTGETRSALVRRAIALLFAEKEREQRNRAYMAGYRAMPETEQEIRAAEAAAADPLTWDPWE